MNTTDHPPDSQGLGNDESGTQQAGSLHSIAEMKRSSSDALLGGVCSGAARYLNLDPIVVRVIVVVATVLGGAGVLLYLVAWLVLPSDIRPSFLARAFKLTTSEPVVRLAILLVATTLWVVSVFHTFVNPGFGFGAWRAPHVFWLLCLLVLAVVLMVSSRRDRSRREAAPIATNHDQGRVLRTSAGYAAAPSGTQTPFASGPGQVNPTPVPPPREPTSPLLLGLTASVIAVVLPTVYLTTDSLPWVAYVAIALAIVGMALIVSTVWGDGGWLYAVGVGLTAVLIVGTATSVNIRSGQIIERPLIAEQVLSDYRFDFGGFELDLTNVANPDELEGRTINITTGVGSTVVYVNNEIDVITNARVGAGDLMIFNKRSSGMRVDLEQSSSPSVTSKKAVTLNITHRLGSIEVIER